MTPVLFHFVTPEGVPLANALVEVQLSRSAHDIEISGVLMPRLVEGTTDILGKLTLNLWAHDAPYIVSVLDTKSDAALSYKFYVPEQTAPVRLQDIVVVGAMSAATYDEAALLVIHATKAITLTYQVAAAASAASAAASASSVNTGVLASAASATNAANSATAAAGSASLASTAISTSQASAAAANLSKIAAAASEAVAVAAEVSTTTKSNNANTSAVNAANSATIATTQAGISTTGATNASASATSATTSAATATSQASISTTQANTATTKASEASTSATASSLSANASAASATAANTFKLTAQTSAIAALASETAATTQASNALLSANNASVSATTATTQAGISTTQATNAAASAVTAATGSTTATNQATIATTQAGTATTKATETATSATASSNSATASAGSATASNTSRLAAQTSASAALASEQAAATHNTNAGAFSTSASGSASTATTQAGIATTKATESSSSATASANSASSVNASANTATTKANEASTSATNAASSAAAAASSANAATSGGVRFDAVQTLTIAEQTQARSNIGFLATVRATVLTGLITANSTVVSATNTVLEAIGFLQKQSIDTTTLLSAHTGNTANPHSVSKTQVGLSEVDNTSDLNKPVSTAQATADSAVQAASTPIAHVGSNGTAHAVATTTVNGFLSSTDKTKLDSVATGATNYVHPANHLPSVITQDVNNRFVADTQIAIWNSKQDALVSGTNIKTIGGVALLGVGNITLVTTKADIGLGNVDNTSDVNKPVSTAQAAADAAVQASAATDATAKANAAQAASTPVAHVGSGGTTHANASITVAGFLSATDKTKLDGVATGATNYVHPANHPPSVITQDASNRFVTDAEKTSWDAKQPAGSYVTGTGTVSGTNTGDQDLSGKQNVLVSGTNIKTVNGISILGTGNLALPNPVALSIIFGS